MGKVLSNRLNKINSALKNTVTSTDYPDYVRNQLQDKVNSEWDYASDRYNLEKENNSTLIFESLTVRLVAPYQLPASSTVKDDFRTVLFKDLQYNALLGDKYRFNNTYYLTIDTGRSFSSTSSALIQKCNDTAKWYNDNGLLLEEPVIVTRASLRELDDDRVMALPTNQVFVYIKYNTSSKQIKWADVNSANNKFTRFIFNGKVYRTVGTDPHTLVRDGNGILELRCQEDMIKDGDDFINGIADNSTSDAIVTILNGNSTIAVGQTLQLNTTVTVDGNVINNPTLKYTSSNPTKATVSPTGLVTGISTTSPTINLTVEYGDKSSMITLAVTGVISHNYSIDFSASNGNLSTLVLNQSNVYTAKTLDNGVQYVDTVTFNVTDDTGLVPSTYVSVVEIIGNTIKIKANNISGNVGKYFRIYGVGTNKTDYIRVMIKGIF